MPIRCSPWFSLRAPGTHSPVTKTALTSDPCLPLSRVILHPQARISSDDLPSACHLPSSLQRVTSQARSRSLGQAFTHVRSRKWRRSRFSPHPRKTTAAGRGGSLILFTGTLGSHDRCAGLGAGATAGCQVRLLRTRRAPSPARVGLGCLRGRRGWQSGHWDSAPGPARR